MAEPTKDLVSLAGGELKIRAVVEDFYARVFSDVMIGFMFVNSDRGRLIQKETELALHSLGAPTEYTGRSMASVHARFDIRKGMFDRRMVLLKSAMEKQGLHPQVQAAWLGHAESLRAVILNARNPNCND
ncbi:MAG: group 1 truncated hemoglobin [Bdellovibrionales bacterium]|nr:group 1 truncated hemoglobin [Bdellovibrionales bacterium]